MMPLVVVVVLIGMLVFEFWLTYLNHTYKNHPIPQHISDIYDPKSYQTWRKYDQEKVMFSVVMLLISTIMTLIFIFVLSPWWITIVSFWTDNVVLNTVLFLGLYALISYVISSISGAYMTFHIEQRYGFNKTDVKTYVSDRIKQLLLMVILGGSILSLLVYLYVRFSDGFIIMAWSVMVLLILIMSILYTKFFIKLFNKLTVLEEGPLKEAIEAFAKDVGYPIKSIYVMDASKRSTKLNAFFSGFGKFKDIVLYDTLIKKLTIDEIVAVLAHEIGHAKHKDVIKNSIQTFIVLGLYLLLFSYLVSMTFYLEQFNMPIDALGFQIFLFVILTSPLEIVTDVVFSYLSQKKEYRADGYAKRYGYQKALISALKKLSLENFSNLTPHPIVVALRYSHPPVAKRVSALMKN